MSVRILQGDAREVLPTFASSSFNTCVTSPPYFRLRSYLPGDSPEKAREIGQESALADYIAALVAVFDEVRRVLRHDGTLWLNIGDSYAAGGRGGGGRFMSERRDTSWSGQSSALGWRCPPPGLKQKDLIGVPWRVAFALQAAGWFLRSEIVWAKPNPMPESVVDRPTRSHEQLFLFAKSARYFYDADAIREPHVDPRTSKNGSTARRGQLQMKPTGRAESRARWFPEGGRNRRDVWTIAPETSGGEHYAAMPRALVRPCVLAGSTAGGHVIDPFGGSGTVGLVAQELGRDATLVDLNPKYVAMARGRIDAAMPLFAEAEAPQ